MTRVLSTLSEYGVPIGEGVRSASPSNLEEIGAWLPADLSNLKRVKAGGRGDEVNLEVELQAIQTEFQAAVDAAMPDSTLARTVEGVNFSDDAIVISDCEKIPLRSIQGIALVEFLNGVARGEDPEVTVLRWEEDLGAIKLPGISDNRGLSSAAFQRWSEGRIVYRLGEHLGREYTSAVLSAMDKNEEASGGSVKFVTTDSWWHGFLAGIWCAGTTVIDRKSLGPGYLGLTDSKCGYVGGNRYLWLNNDLWDDALRRTPVHELCHVLGMAHEHQRPDRDQYLNLSNGQKNDDQFAKIPETVVRLEIRWKSVKMFGVKVSIPYPYYGEDQLALVVGPFDEDSIMLSSGIERTDGGKTVWNLDRSSTDIATLRRLS